MAFININKVTLEDTSDSKVAMAHVVLLYASIIHDCVENGEYDKALYHIKALNNASACLEQHLKY